MFADLLFVEIIIILLYQKQQSWQSKSRHYFSQLWDRKRYDLFAFTCLYTSMTPNRKVATRLLTVLSVPLQLKAQRDQIIFEVPFNICYDYFLIFIKLLFNIGSISFTKWLNMGTTVDFSQARPLRLRLRHWCAATDGPSFHFSKAK